MLKDVVKYVMLIKFLNQVDDRIKSYVEKFSIYARLAIRQNKGVARFKQMYRKAIDLMPKKKDRLNANLYLSIYLMISMQHKPIKSKAATLISNTIS